MMLLDGLKKNGSESDYWDILNIQMYVYLCIHPSIYQCVCVRVFVCVCVCV
jgi:hypothetical protein